MGTGIVRFTLRTLWLAGFGDAPLRTLRPLLLAPATALHSPPRCPGSQNRIARAPRHPSPSPSPSPLLLLFSPPLHIRSLPAPHLLSTRPVVHVPVPAISVLPSSAAQSPAFLAPSVRPCSCAYALNEVSSSRERSPVYRVSITHGSALFARGHATVGQDGDASDDDNPCD